MTTDPTPSTSTRVVSAPRGARAPAPPSKPGPRRRQRRDKARGPRLELDVRIDANEALRDLLRLVRQLLSKR